MNSERLLHLADFLEALPERKFYYGAIVSGTDVPRDTFDCGSTGCAVGWCPLAFPEHFKYVPITDYDGVVEVTVFAKKDGRTYGSAIRVFAYQHNMELEEFFDIERQEVLGLFYPGKQSLVEERSLKSTASAKDVATLIRRFVEKQSV